MHIGIYFLSNSLAYKKGKNNSMIIRFSEISMHNTRTDLRLVK